MSSSVQRDTRDWARFYLGMGIMPIPVPRGGKGPRIPKWEQMIVTDSDIDSLFSPTSNINAHLLPPWVDVDLDCDEARKLAPLFLPTTTMIHGRPTNPYSHYWYRTHAPLAFESFNDVPVTMPDGKKKPVRILEIRAGKGHSTMLPGSIFENEAPLWHEGPEPPAPMEGLILRDQVAKLAAFSLLARHWPGKGARHQLALAVAGALARRDWHIETVVEIVQAVARAAGDEEAFSDRTRAAADTVRARHAERKITGIPTIASIIGDEATALWCAYLGFERTDTVESYQLDLSPTIAIDTETGEVTPYEPTWQDILANTNRVEIANMPLYLQEVMRRFERMYKDVFVEDITSRKRRVVHDYGAMLALTGWSMGLQDIYVENLRLNLWFCGIARRGSTKSVLTNECILIFKDKVFNHGLKKGDAPRVNYITDGSMEGVWSELEGENQVALMHHDEFSTRLKQSQKDWANALKFQLNSLYDGSNVRKTLSGKRTVDVIRPYTTLITQTVPASLDKYLSEEDFTSGFMSRILICLPDYTHKSTRTGYLPDSVIENLGGDPTRDILAKELREHWRTRVRPIRTMLWECTMSPEPGGAMAIYHNWLQKDDGKVHRPEEDVDDTDPPSGRVIVWAKKMAALLTLLDPHFETLGETVDTTTGEIRRANPSIALIPEKWVEQAIYLAERARAYSIRAVDIARTTQRTKEEATIERFMERHWPVAMTAREVQQQTKLNSDTIKNTLTMLAESGILLASPTPSGRSKVYVWVKPEER